MEDKDYGSPVLSKLIHVDSEDRINKSTTTDTNFTINLGSKTEVRVCRKMVLKSVSFPNIFYNVSSGSNILQWRDNTDAKDYSITITPGQYNSSTLLSALTTAASAQVSAGTVTFALNTTTNKVTVTFSDVQGMIYGSAVDDTATTMAQIGFLQNSSVGSSVTADSIINLIGLTEVFLNSNALCYGNLIRSDQSILPTIMKFNINVAYGQQFIYESKDESLDSIYHHHGGADLNTFDISLTDRYGTQLDLMGRPMKLLFKIYYTSVTGLQDF